MSEQSYVQKCSKQLIKEFEIKSTTSGEIIYKTDVIIDELIENTPLY